MHSSHFPSFLNYALSSVFRRSFAVLIVVFVCATTLFVRAQDAANKRGFHPGNSYSLGDFETINTTNGNVMLRFPLGSLGAGRGDVNASINLVYNSKLYDGETEYFRNELYPCEYPPQDEAPYPGHCPYYTKNVLKPSEEGGWQYFLGFQLKMEDRRSQYANVPYLEQPQCRDYYGGVADGYLTMTYVHKLFVIFPDGSKHEMIPNTYANDMLQDRYFRVRHDGVLEDCGGYQQHTGSAMAYHSVDGTFVRLEFYMMGIGILTTTPGHCISPTAHVTTQ